jgi:heterodisulfide reductase subunit A
MTACYNHPLVKTLAYSDLLEVKGEAPDFVAVVKIKPRYVDEDLCKGCNDCFAKCPVKVKSEFDMGIGLRKAIYKPFAQAIPNKAIIDKNTCRNCGLCDKACSVGAIKHDQQEIITEIPVSAVVMATGYDLAGNIPKEFGYDRYEDVVTSLEYERILCASGPYEGHVARPSDRKEPKRIAFIQCVGSRDHQCDSDYCSSVCCMYAIKNAIITKEHLPTVEDIDIFYMDMRAFGKAFDSYVDSARDRYSVGLVRSRVSGVDRDEESGQLLVQYTDDKGASTTQPYDMVVLSVGFKPNDESVNLLNKTGVKTDKYGFVWSHEFNATVTTREGIYACGVAAGPKDIPETVIEASAAAAAAAKMAYKREVKLYKDYSNFFKEEAMPEMRDVSKEPIKIGVFLCYCGVNIGGYADVADIVDYAKGLPFVVHTESFQYTCAIDSQKIIADRMEEHGLNRLVVAACTPRTHEPLFQDVLAKAGLNPYLFAMANIRDQCTWVHMDDKAAATFKAKEMVRMAVGKVTFAKQLTRKSINVTKSAMIVGGGVSGMTAALELAGMGYHAHLVESSEGLGGNAHNLATSNKARPVEPYLNRMIGEVANHPNINVYLNTAVESIDGYVGNFKTMVRTGAFSKEINHGVIIVAIGAGEMKPNEYMYGKNSSVITQLELEGHASENFAAFKGKKHVVMIQCVGSREDDKPYCSRVCCNQAVKNALLLQEQYDDLSVTILYRDMRTYGMGELLYRDARKAGVKFIRYEDDKKPVVEDKDGGLVIKLTDPVLGEEVTLPADYLVLSAAIEANTDNNLTMAKMVKVPLNQSGFFLEAHVKLRPVDFATEGVYICGLAHNPKNTTECIIQGKAAAGRAATVIAKEQLETEGAIAAVHAEYCSACGDCEKVCPYKAIEVVDVPVRGGTVRQAVINEVLCKGCGTCSANCRCGAIDVNGFSDRQIVTEIEYLLRKPTAV